MKVTILIEPFNDKPLTGLEKELVKYLKMERHIIFTYKGKVYQSFKTWDFERIERVLTRLGASYWEIG